MKPALRGYWCPFIHSRGASSRCVGALVAVLLFAIAGPAGAAVTCSVSAPAIGFGAYDVFAGSQITSTTTISVTCTLTGIVATTVSYTIALSPGLSGTFVQRTMMSGVDALGYNLYSNATRTTTWGDGTGGAPTVSGSMRLTRFARTQTNNHTVYGSVPALQDVAVGAYAETIIITVTY